MSGQKRPCDPSASSSSSSSGVVVAPPPEKRRERDGGEDAGAGGVPAGGSTAVETVIKLGGVSNSVRERHYSTGGDHVVMYSSKVLLTICTFYTFCCC